MESEDLDNPRLSARSVPILSWAAPQEKGTMYGFQGCRRALGTRRTTSHTRPRQRLGAAVVELAVLLPLLVFLFLIATDFARVFYFSLTLTNCARAGALYASDPTVMAESPFASAQEAALADATNMSPQPTITQGTGVDALGRPYVQVTATHSFTTITGFPGIPNSVNLQRTVRLYVAANNPTSF